MSTPSTSELRALLAAATPGPWYVVGNDGCDGDSLTPDFDAEEQATVSANKTERGWCTDSGCPGYGISVENARLIAAAVNALPTLLDRIEELEKEQAK